VAVTPDDKRVYITNQSVTTPTGPTFVSVLITANNSLSKTIPIAEGQSSPSGVAVTPGGTRVYVANNGNHTVSVIAVPSDRVIATVPVGLFPFGVAVHPDGTRVYVTSQCGVADACNSRTLGNVWVLDTATNTVIAAVQVGISPIGVAVTPDGTHIYVANNGSGTVSVIDTTSNSVVNEITVGSNPFAFGQFIGPDSLP